MIGFLISLLFFTWGYKLVKIIRSTKSIMGFTKEFERLSRQHKYSNEGKSARYQMEAENYKRINKKITKSNFLWFFIEIGSMLFIYHQFIGKNPLVLF